MQNLDCDAVVEWECAALGAAFQGPRYHLLGPGGIFYSLVFTDRTNRSPFDSKDSSSTKWRVQNERIGLECTQDTVRTYI